MQLLISDSNSFKSCSNSLHILSSSALVLIPSIQMLIEAFNNLIVVDKILLYTCIYCKPNKNLPPLVCLYFENLNSRQSICNRDVKTYLYFFPIRISSIRNAIHWRVMTRAVFVCLLKVNFENFCSAYFTNPSANLKILVKTKVFCHL